MDKTTNNQLYNLYSAMEYEDLMRAIEDIGDYTQEAAKIIIEEVRKRNIKLDKIYYYRINDEQKGPYDKIEMLELAKSNVITPNTFMWRTGLKNWMLAKDFNAFIFQNNYDTPPPFHDSTSGSLLKHNDSRLPGKLIACAIMLIVFGIYWTIVSLIQISSPFYILGIFNIISAIAIWFCVYGLFKKQSWSYGVILYFSIASIIMLLIELYTGWIALSPHLIFILLISIALIIMISFNKDILRDNKIKL